MASSARDILAAAKGIDWDIQNLSLIPEEGLKARTDQVLAFSHIRGTTGYLEKVIHQINGSYENGWFDACAVMIRRLVETLIIETFENHKIASKIKNKDGDFFFLRDLITATLQEPQWTLGRATKRALPKLKDVGDKSAHSRRYTAHKRDIDSIKDDLRISVQELLYLAELK